MLRFRRPCKCWMPTKALKSKQMKKRKENKRKSRKFLAWALSFNKGIKLEKKEIIMIRFFCPVVFSFLSHHQVVLQLLRAGICIFQVKLYDMTPNDSYSSLIYLANIILPNHSPFLYSRVMSLPNRFVRTQSKVNNA